MREGQWYFACGGGVQGGGAPLRPLANENLVFSTAQNAVLSTRAATSKFSTPASRLLLVAPSISKKFCLRRAHLVSTRSDTPSPAHALPTHDHRVTRLGPYAP